MGYESKVYVVQEYAPFAAGRLGYGDKIAMVDLCKMGYDTYNGKRFPDLFSEERTCDIYMDDGETIIEEDCYGQPIQKAPDNLAVIRWLEASRKGGTWYRAEVLLSILKRLEKDNVEYSLYHYGY